MKIGTQTSIGGQRFEVAAIYADGRVLMRPVAIAAAPNRSKYALGETVNALVDDGLLVAEVVSLHPLQARITAPGPHHNFIASSWRLRKRTAPPEPEPPQPTRLKRGVRSTNPRKQPGVPSPAPSPEMRRDRANRKQRVRRLFAAQAKREAPQIAADSCSDS